MLTPKHREMRESLTFAGISQFLVVATFTFIGTDLRGWKGSAGGFLLSYLLMGVQTVGMWTTSNLRSQMFKAGEAVAAGRSISWLLTWPFFLWRSLKFVMTEAYVPDS